MDTREKQILKEAAEIKKRLRDEDNEKKIEIKKDPGTPLLNLS